MDQRTASRVLRILEEAYPEARCQLNHSEPLELLLAIILSAQCTDERINRVTPTLFKKYPTAKAIAEARQSDIEKIVYSCGFYRQKARALRSCCKAILEKHGGNVPNDYAALVKLDGVGRKTANVFLNVMYGAPRIAVDTHVLRTSNRLGWAHSKDPLKVEGQIEESVPKRWWVTFSLIMIFHGRHCCSARRPNCPACPVLKYCPYEEKFGI